MRGKYSPWGKIQDSWVKGAGIHFVSTAGHGGFKLDRARNKEIPTPFRRKGGWYEEDCEAYIIFWLCSDARPTSCSEEEAKAAVKNWYPDEYAAVTGELVKPEESRVLRKRVFENTNYEKFTTSAAWGDWAPGVPKGFVRVFAKKKSTGEEKFFLVPAAEYETREPGIHSFVIDESKHTHCRNSTEVA